MRELSVLTTLSNVSPNPVLPCKSITVHWPSVGSSFKAFLGRAYVQCNCYMSVSCIYILS